MGTQIHQHHDDKQDSVEFFAWRLKMALITGSKQFSTAHEPQLKKKRREEPAKSL